LPMLIQNIEARLLEDSDPLVYEGLQISPSIDNKLPINASLPVLFKLYSPAGELDRWKIVATAKLVKDTGEELSLLPFTLEENVPQAYNTEATLGFRMTFQGVSPGKYTLIIETTDAASSHNAVVQTDVEFVEN
jgi:hypothetical protein